MLPLSKNPNLSVYLVQANHQCSKGIATKKQRKQQTISAQLLERVVSELSSKLNLVMPLLPQWKGWTRFQDKPKKSSVGKWNSWLGCIIVISWPSRASVLKRKKGALSVGWQTIQKGWSKREKLINALSICGVQLTL